MRVHLFAVTTLVLGACADLGTDSEVAADQDTLFGLPGSYWPMNPLTGDTLVPVCWVPQGWATEKQWVRSQVESEWGAASTIVFTGWGDCNAQTPASAVRIDVQDVRPNSNYGIFTASPVSMQLNFTFHQWMTRSSPFLKWGWLVSNCEDLDREYCIRGIALHEFGHALGFQHEQNRPDNFGQCSKEVMGGTGDLLTPYDLDSIMNYCYEWGRQTITARDVDGLQEVYGLAHAPAATIRGFDGRLHVFVRGAGDRAIWHRSQVSAGGGWSAWSSLGGALKGDPAVGLNADGRLEVAARVDDGNLWHTWEYWPGGAWAPWYPYPALQVTSTPAMERNLDGRLELVVRGPASYFYHVWQVAPNSGWSGWASFGGEPLNGAPVMVREWSGRLLIFARTSFGTIGYNRQSVPNGGWDGIRWVDGTSFASAPAVAVDGTGRVAVFARGKDGAIYRTRQSNVGDVNYDGWSSLGGWLGSAPTVARNADGRLEVFARGGDKAIWHTWEGSVGGSWSGWYSSGGTFSSGVAVVSDLDGRIEAFARRPDATIAQMWQTTPNGGWISWISAVKTTELWQLP